MATKAELLQNVSAEELPATAVAPEYISEEPLTEIEVGGKVVIFSRGMMRLAQVLTLAPTRVTVAYTTVGAWKEAQKIVEQRLMSDYTALRVAATRKVEASNYDFYVRESSPETAHFAKDEADRAKYAKHTEGLTREEFIEAQVAKTKAACEAAIAEAQAGPTQYVTITTKTVKRTEVYGLRAGVAA